MRKATAPAVALLAAACLGAAGRCSRGSRAGADAPDRLTILYLADLGGQVEPCGCSEGQRGGLPRLATLVAAVRRESPNTVLLAGGDLLFEHDPDPLEREQALLKARAVAEALRKMGLAATARGERDLFAGEAFAKATGLPFGPARVGVLGFGELGQVPDAPLRAAVVHAGGSQRAAPLAGAAKERGVHLLFGSHRESLIDDDVNRALLDAPVPVVQVQGRGQSVARVDLRFAGDLSRGFTVVRGAAQRDEELDLIELRRAEYGRRRAAAEASGNAALARALGDKLGELEARARTLRETPLPAPPADRPSLTVSFIPVAPEVPEEPEVKAIVTRYYAEVARRNLEAARAEARPCPPAAKGDAVYVGAEPSSGPESCRSCHPAAYHHWKTTRHAHAWATLVRISRQADLDCIGCHVTGWQRPGGVCDVARTEGREDVQCESCHGPGSLHVADPPAHIVRDPPEALCRECHTPENSTHFEPVSYRSRIVGLGHGLPAEQAPGRAISDPHARPVPLQSPDEGTGPTPAHGATR